MPGLQEKILSILGGVMPIPNAGGFGGGISPPKQDPLDQVAHLDQQRDAGKITDAEFEAQKRKLLGEGSVTTPPAAAAAGRSSASAPAVAASRAA